ncbi:adenylyl-sulfate kinase [Azospirillum sp.]|uniref:adenylyl-sulfate kinase n=1 Tax=Azospirillum sp. TaxID=34012 RepID=UPI00260EDE15|nr:adenylyl-sulfate kinase [Azospirillum sp.]
MQAIDSGVFWVTGLSGAGKTTVANALRDRLVRTGRPTVLLDGDRMRAVLDAERDHHPAARRRLAFIYARLCREIAGQGLTVVCATISMFHDVRRWNRLNIPGYHEVWLRVPREELVRRDAKGIYAAAASGSGTPVVGVHTEPEEPQTPDLVIDNFGTLTVDMAVEEIWRSFFPASIDETGATERED